MEALQQSLQTNQTTSTRRLSGELGASKDSIGRALHKLGKVNRCCREVPHELNSQQAKNRVDICRKLLENPRDDRFIKRIVTSDEKWIYLNNPDNRNQWLDRGEPAKPVVKLDRFQKKVMLCVWWNFEQVIHFEILYDGGTTNSDIYCDQLDQMYKSLLVKYPTLVYRGKILLQHDNAKPHTSRKIKEKISKLDGIELMPHPAYSPDLAPSDYHMFRSMATFFKGKRFTDVGDVENGCRDFFSSKPKTWYRHGIEDLARRWLLTIENNEMYFET
jgi:histone-lysine N-methyltransferase SETMAR